MHRMCVFSFVSAKNPKIAASPESKKICMVKNMVPVEQSGYDNIQDMLTVACGENSKLIYTTATTNSDSFGEKTKKLSAPSSENGANDGVRSRETVENSAKGVVVLTITTD